MLGSFILVSNHTLTRGGKERMKHFMAKERMKTLKKYLEADEVEEKNNYFIADGDEYLVLTDKEADEAVAENIKDSLWAFNANFILSECGLASSGAESLKTMQEKSCESANDFILSLVERTCGFKSFVESAISADGRGHFLSSYDGDELELDGDFYAYRTK
jgi:hypothetical protein